MRPTCIQPFSSTEKSSRESGSRRVVRAMAALHDDSGAARQPLKLLASERMERPADVIGKGCRGGRRGLTTLAHYSVLGQGPAPFLSIAIANVLAQNKPVWAAHPRLSLRPARSAVPATIAFALFT